MKKRRIISLLLAGAMSVSLVPGVHAQGGDTGSTGIRDRMLSFKGAEKPQIVQEAEQAASTNGLRLWYTKPANDWETESLVIGNGHMGSLIFGKVGTDKIHINDNNMWSGGPAEGRDYFYGNRSEPVTQETIQEVQQALEEEESLSAHTSDLQKLWGSFSQKGSYLDFGDVYVDFSPAGQTEDQTTGYVRDLDLNTGIASVQYQIEDATYYREYFTSYPDEVQVYHYTSDTPGMQSFDVSMTAANSATVTAEGNTITFQGALSDNGLKFEAQLRVVADGGTVEAVDNKIQVRGADSVTLMLASGTDYKMEPPTYRGEDPHAKLTADLDAAEEKGFHGLRNAHITDHYTLFSRVKLDLGAKPSEVPTDVMMENYRQGKFDVMADILVYQFGRYLLIAGSREGYLPTNLQGLWGEGSMEWGSDFHMNVNFQMNYWPAYVNNLADCAISMIDFVDALREPGRTTAWYSHGVKSEEGEEEGWVVHTGTNIYGMTTGGDSQEWGWNIGGAAWLMTNVYEYYQFTQDLDYLETKIYPILREQARFWDHYLIRSPKQDNRWVVSPSVSPEQGPTVMGCTFDQSVVWQVYEYVLEASEALGVDEDLRDEWREKRDNLKPIQIGEEGQIKEWYEESRIGYAKELIKTENPDGSVTWEQGEEYPLYNFNAGGAEVHRHVSHLTGLYPGTLINKDTEEWMEAAKVSLEHRGFETTTGWSKGHRLCMWARTCEGNKAYRMVQAFLTQNTRGIMNNLLDSHGAHGGSLENSYPLFQIDGNYGYTAGMGEMFLQSHLGYIQPLAALPDAWHTGSVSGLVARGNFVCDMAWSNKVLNQMTLTSNAGSDCVIEYKGIGNATVTGPDGAVKFEKLSDDKISFPTEKGAQYTITGIPGSVGEDAVRPENVRSFRTGDTSIHLGWDAADGVKSYDVYRQILDVVPDGKQSAGTLYGQGYHKIATVETNSYVDTDVDADDVCYYYVVAEGASMPVMTVDMDMDAAIVQAKTLLEQFRSSADCAAITEGLQACIEAAEALAEDAPFETILQVYMDITAMTEACAQLTNVPAVVDRAKLTLDTVVPGEHCTQEQYQALEDAVAELLAALKAFQPTQDSVDTIIACANAADQAEIAASEGAEAVIALRQRLESAQAIYDANLEKAAVWEDAFKVVNALGAGIQEAKALLDASQIDADQLNAATSKLNDLCRAVEALIGSIKVDITIASGAATMTVSNSQLQIRYTLDGNDPSMVSPLYEEPVQLPSRAVTVKAAAFAGHVQVSDIVSKTISGANLALNAAATSPNPDWSEDWGIDTNYQPRHAVDGNKSTAWSPKVNLAEMTIDLGAVHAICSGAIYGDSYGRIQGFEIQVRASESDTWQTVYTGTTLPANFDFEAVDARYVRYVTTKSSGEPNIDELEIYGVPETGEDADLTALNAAIAEAKETQKSDLYLNAHKEMQDRFDSYLAAAEAVAANENSDQASVDAAAAALKGAAEYLSWKQVIVNNGSGSGFYAKDATVTIFATPTLNGKAFTQWSVDRGSIQLTDASATETTFIMPATDVEVTADYLASGGASYIIKAVQSEGGRISPASRAVGRGGNATFTITADEGYSISDVLVDGKSVGAVETYTFKNVSAKHTISAEFTKSGETSKPVAGFDDVHEDDWFAEAVQYVVDKGLMNGTSETAFTPNGATTRGMIVTILYRQAGSPEVESDDASWWSDARVWAMDNGVSDGTNMDKAITREQLATMLYRYAELQGEDITTTTALDEFTDAASVSDWAAEALSWAVGSKIVTGKTGNVLDPNAGATRAETATMLMRYCELTK